MYLGGIYRDNFTLLACIELPYALHLADGSKMERNMYCVLPVESVCLRSLFGPYDAVVRSSL